MHVTAVLKMVLDSVPREVSEKCIHLTPFTVCLSGPCVTMAILRIQFVGAHVDIHKQNMRMHLNVLLLPSTTCRRFRSQTSECGT